MNFEWRMPPDVWKVFADQAQLELALMNLIINARDAMPAGGTVTISAENHKLGADEIPGAEPGDYVRLAVEDTGTGIPDDHLEKVMEPFFTTKEVGKGSGLGLSMVYGFARQSNGLFRIESTFGKGTTAELWLPRAPSSAQPRPAQASRKKPRRLQSKLKILLVDDHSEVRSTTAAVLEDLGHKVVEAENGAQALGELDENCDFDLFISDYAMPQLSGTEFLREAEGRCPDVPALIITGYAEADAIRDRPKDVAILQKPFTPEALENAIDALCRERMRGPKADAG
jgi:CheY-like chemotaxis protein